MKELEIDANGYLTMYYLFSMSLLL